MTNLDTIAIEISVELGSTSIPIHQLLRMGRGAVIELDAHEEDDCLIKANDIPVALGQVILRGEKVGISITKVLNRSADWRPLRGLQRVDR
ncbi:FliM/FliN family flagellar motor switch protein [Cohaesibacter celericrescens]|uniref:Flagellar motor switch protein FliN n=1 Tax=Cohaesibacter celericrescens TaxID=2067669 RepID=A0A2N5XVL0_9HYPH|nr:FliM/FliN family flagellar motor switch protein [Cohaesibacter celericrescens]PLW78542.1 flagellar motor switch protein FliN [Cohaesibacter celericrescens]